MSAPAFPSLPSLPLPTPPDWIMHELRQRVVLLLNHILQQEPEAMARLSRKKGQVVAMEYAQFALTFIATPAGLLDLAPQNAAPDLTIRVHGDNPLTMLQTLLGGDKPRMDISGDVMLAAEVNWLVDHVRWDVEEDLSRIMGDVPAHSLMRVLRGAGDVMRKFVANAPSTPFNPATQANEQAGA